MTTKRKFKKKMSGRLVVIEEYFFLTAESLLYLDLDELLEKVESMRKLK